jgi:hypothetical protein
MVLVLAKDINFQIGVVNGNDDEKPAHTVTFKHDF